MGARVAGLTIGVVFGLVLCWTGVSDPDVIRRALLFEDSYLFLFFASAVLVATTGLRLLRRLRPRALLTGAPIAWTPERLQRRHVIGSVVFGMGWGVANVCPGPILTHVGQGIPWALFTFAGAAGGVYLFLRRSEETEPAADAPPAAAAASGRPLTASPS
jgi:uncharacterized membrane protein YedE/YeeE